MSKYIILLCVVFASVQVQAALLSSQKDVLQPALSKYRSTVTQMTDEQVAELKTEYFNEKSERTFKFTSGFAQLRLDPKKAKSKISKYKASGKVPIRITAELVEMRVYKGKNVSKRANGTARIYVLDTEGKIVLKKSMSLSVMCPG